MTSASFSPSGGYLLTTSDDQTTRVWDAATCATAAVLGGHGSRVLLARFVGDGNIVTVSSEGVVRLWRVPSLDEGKAAQAQVPGADEAAALVDRARRTLPRALTIEQRTRYFLSKEPPRWYVTGAGAESETDTSSWRPLWPYDTLDWLRWRTEADAAVSVGSEPPAMPV